MTTIETLSTAFDDRLTSGQTPNHTLNEVVRIVGTVLNADRCFLYVRQPERRHGRIAFCWCKDETIPDVIQPDWQPDTTDLPREDPLFRAAIEGRPSVYVDDVETAGPDVLNREYERRTFGHRALIHAHIQRDGQLWGILQPCGFLGPRPWTEIEKRHLEGILPRLQPVIAAYVGSV